MLASRLPLYHNYQLLFSPLKLSETSPAHELSVPFPITLNSGHVLYVTPLSGLSFTSCLICPPWLSPFFCLCSFYCYLCSGHSQVPLSVLSIISTIRTFPSVIPWSRHVLCLYIWCRDAQFIHLVPKEACSLCKFMMTICPRTTELHSLSLLLSNQQASSALPFSPPFPTIQWGGRSLYWLVIP